jgi:subtilisin-like proprotein convertase family protein
MKTSRRLAAFSGLLLGAAGTLAVAPTTDAALYTPGSTIDMTIATNANQSSPPAVIVPVFGAATTVADVNVVLTGLTHTNPDDLDIELVHTEGPTSKTAVALMSDVCGTTNLSAATLTLDDQAPTALPDSTACGTGSWRPNNVDSASDSFDVPPGGSALSAFNGKAANGQWTLYVRDDDSSGAGGSLSGWSLQITTAADASITIPGPASGTGGGPAAPYPFQIPVSGHSAPISDVNLTLPGLTHTDPGELDVLLVGPFGQRVLVMSDGCGNDASNVTLVFDDQAPARLPSASGTCASGSYQPTNFGTPDSFDAPAPGGPYAETLAAFNGGPADGTWLLYVRDDTNSYDTGWLLGVPSLTITTDSQPPDTKIKKKPHTSTSTTATLKLKSTEPGSTFECKVDHKKFKPCQAKLRLRGLKVGKHKVLVRATDPAGNTDPSPAKATWRVLRGR